MEELTILQHDEDFNQATTFEKAQSMLLHAFNQADDEDKEYAAELLDAWERELDQLMVEAACTIESTIRPTGATLH